MADPYLGEIRVFAFSYAPEGWAKCDGTTMLIAQNQALYTLLHIQFGGDGNTNFKLPDLRGRVPLNYSSTYPLGLSSGFESVQLTENTMPYHNHDAFGTNQNGDSFKPGTNKSLATSPALDDPIYITPLSNETLIQMNGNVITDTGIGTAHANIQPCLVLNFCIATTGTYPPRP